MEDELDLRQYWFILRRWLWLIVLATVLAAGTAFLVSGFREPVYAAEATLGIIPSKTEVTFQSAIRAASEQEVVGAALTRQERRQTFADVAGSVDVAEAVWQRLGPRLPGAVMSPEDIRGWVSVDTPRDRDVITIRVTHPDPQTAARVANVWADEAARQINRLYGNATLTPEEVAAQVTEAKAGYDQAQAALVDFLGTNDLDRLSREIGERGTILERLDRGVAARTFFIEQELESRKQAVADLYAQAQKLDRLITDARSLRAQVAVTGTSSASATANALSLLTLQVGAYTMGAALPTETGTNLPVQLQLSADALLGTPVEPDDVDTLIRLLEAKRSEVQEEIRVLAGQLVREGGADFLFEAPSPEDPLLAALRESYPQLFATAQPSPATSAGDDPITAAVESLQAEIQTLEQELERQTAQNKEIEETRDLAWEKYTSLARKLEEVRLASESEGTVKVVGAASVPTAPASQRVLLNTALAAIVGLMLAVGAAFLLEYVDDSVRTSAEVSRLLDLRPLGAVPLARDPAAAGPAWLSGPRTPEGEALRMIRTNIQIASPQGVRSLLFLSPEVGEGKSTLVSNLARLFAEAGHKTILVDADLRKPRLHRLLGVPNDAGLSNVLAGAVGSVADVNRETEWPGLSFVSSGPLPPNPSELLGSPRLAEVLETLREKADLILIDAPAGLAVADGLLLAKETDAVVLVAEAGRTSRSALRELRDELAALGATVLGVVLNKVKGEAARRYGYYAGAGAPGAP